jgi:hypothetical protein
MKKSLKISTKQFIVLISILLIITSSSFAQYTGGNGDGYSSAVSPATNFGSVAPITPAAPVATSATSIVADGFVANWNTSSGATKYYLDVDDNSDFSSPLGSYNNLVVGNVLTYSVTGLAPNRTYYYRLRAYNTNGTSASSNTINLTTTLKALTITGISISNKSYNGNTTATISGTPVLNGVYGSEVVTLVSTGATATFNNKNVGTGKAITVAGYTISGTDAGNYTLTQPTGLTANITAISLSITGISISNKSYNGNTTASITGTAALSGVISPDVVNLVSTGATATFNNKNVGTGKPITVSGYTITGTDAGNYTLTQPTGLTANITAIGLSITGISISNKSYDGNTTASISGTAALSGVINPDVVNLISTGASANFNNKNVGTGKAITVAGYTISGTDAGNYTLAQPTGLTANITAIGLSITGISISNKSYNGNTTATITGTPSLSGVIGSDVVNIVSTGASANFNNENVGTGKAITVSGYTISGTDAGNYAVSQPTGLTANITAINLSITGISINNKSYDGNTTASISGTAALSGVIGSDVVNIVSTGASANFNNENVGTGKAITVSGYTISGTDAGNYTVSQPTGLTANITTKALTITGITASNKEYDGTITANISGGSLSGVISGDVVNHSAGTGVFVNKNVGIGKTITVSGYTISGTDAGNYTVSQPTGLTANITAKSLTIAGLGASNKVYDGTNTANITGGALSGVIPGDVVNLSAITGTFADKNVGNAKVVAISGSSISGTDADNYTLTQPTSLTANITAKTLTIIGVRASNKEYDGTTVATLTGGTLSGLINGDIVSLNPGTGSFADANVGTGKTVTASGYTITGTDAGNYTLTQPIGLSADITKATPLITWENPADVVTGIALSSTQLNATANVGGSFIYTPVSGTVLAVGNNQELKADFSPTDATNYNTASKTVYINVSPATGFIDLAENKISFYPNPATGNVTISGLSAFSGNKTINLIIIDIHGKTLLVKTLVNPINSEQLDVGSIPTGVYFLQLYTDKEKLVKRFVKE